MKTPTKLILLAAGIAAGLVAAEACLRILEATCMKNVALPFLLTDTRYFPEKPDPDIGWQPTPGFHNEVIDINTQGLRSTREFTPYAAAGTTRVMLLGDSFTFGFGVSQKELFSEILNNEMSGFEFINTGVTQYNTVQELFRLKRYAPLLHPNILILFYCQANDMLANSSVGLRAVLQGNSLRYIKPSDVPDPWYIKLRLYRFLNAHYFKGRDMQYVHDRIEFEIYKGNSREWRVTRALLYEMGDYCKKSNIPIIVIDIPAATKKRQDIREQLLEKACQEEGFTYYSLRDYYPVGYEKNLLIPHDCHWNTQGERFIADFLKDVVLRSFQEHRNIYANNN